MAHQNEKANMAGDVAKQIRKATRRQFPAEEKSVMLPKVFQGKSRIAEICRSHKHLRLDLLQMVQSFSGCGQELGLVLPDPGYG